MLIVNLHVNSYLAYAHGHTEPRLCCINYIILKKNNYIHSPHQLKHISVTFKFKTEYYLW